MSRTSLIGMVNNSDEDSSTVSEEEIEPVVLKGRTESKKYFFAEKFASLELAEKSVNKEEIWSKKGAKFEKKTKQWKHFYRCNKVTQQNKVQCCAGLCLVLLANSQEVEVHKTLCAHDHIPF